MNFANRYNNRIPWIDSIKVFAILCVVFGHAWFFADPKALNGYAVIGYQFQKDFIVSFNMPLFVFISGYCASKSIFNIGTIEDLNDYWIKIAKRIAIPSYCCGLIPFFVSSIIKKDIYSCLGGLIILVVIILVYYLSRLSCDSKYNKSISVRYKKIFIIISYAILIYSAVYSYFWFSSMLLQVMMIVSCIMYISNRFSSKRIVPVLFICIYPILLLNDRPLYTEEFLSYFVVGQLCYKLKLINRFVKRFDVVLFLGVVGLTLLLLLSNRDFYSLPLRIILNSEIFWFFLRQLCGMVWIFFFCLIFDMYVQKKSKITQLWGGVYFGNLYGTCNYA